MHVAFHPLPLYRAYTWNRLLCWVLPGPCRSPYQRCSIHFLADLADLAKKNSIGVCVFTLCMMHAVMHADALLHCHSTTHYSGWVIPLPHTNGTKIVSDGERFRSCYFYVYIGHNDYLWKFITFANFQKKKLVWSCCLKIRLRIVWKPGSHRNYENST